MQINPFCQIMVFICTHENTYLDQLFYWYFMIICDVSFPFFKIGLIFWFILFVLIHLFWLLLFRISVGMSIINTVIILQILIRLISVVAAKFSYTPQNLSDIFQIFQATLLNLMFGYSSCMTNHLLINI